MPLSYDALAELVAHSAPLASSINKHFALRPRLRSVARRLLATELATLYPNLDIDLDLATLMEPLPDRMGYRQALLVDALIGRFLMDDNLWFTEGVHFLTLQPGAENPQALAVKMVAVQRLINEWGPQLLRVYDERLCRFWDDFDRQGQSRWQWLAKAMQGRLERSAKDQLAAGTLDAEQAATAQQVVAQPDSHQRRSPPGEYLQVSLLVFPPDPPGSGDTQLTHGIVIERHLLASGRRIVLLFTAFYGLEAFNSPQQMANRLAARELTEGEDHLVLGLRAAAGDIFALQAQMILDQQLGAIHECAAYCRGRRYGRELLEDVVDMLTDFAVLDTADERAHMDKLRNLLPPWLANAGSRARRSYALDLAALAKAQEASKGKSFMEGIPSILDFAAQALHTQIAMDHGDAPLADLDDVQVHIVSMPDALMSIADGGHRTEEDRQISLAQFALCNLSGRPSGALFIQPRAGKTLPDWADRRGIETLITRTNAGPAYLKLLKAQLLGDSEQAKQREALFCSHIAIQLPMLALQYSLQAVHGFDEQTYRAVRQVMTPALKGNDPAVTMQTLGFAVTPGATVDKVENAYVIGPAVGGPLILYRPLNAVALQVFADSAALWGAITVAGDLQDSLLEWLDDAAHTRYANGGLLAPHTERFAQGSDFAPITTPKPATMVLGAIKGPLLPWLYRQNAQALITLANRQSVSSEESRWLGYKGLGVAALNAILPVLSGSVATALWLTQLVSSLDDALKAQIKGDSTRVEEWMVDLCLNIALVLLPFAGVSHVRAERPVLEGEREEAVPLIDAEAALNEAQAYAANDDEPVPDTQAPDQQATLDAQVSELLTATAQLEAGWARSTHTLAAPDQALLTTFALEPPAHLGAPLPHGPYQGLYLHDGELLMRLDTRLFQLATDEGELRIVDPQRPERTGPFVRRDEAQRWQLDLRLRLRGGMPRSRIEALRAQNRERISVLKAQCARYDEQITPAVQAWNALVPKVRAEVPEGDKLELRETFSAKAKVVIDLKREVLAAMLELRRLAPEVSMGAEYLRVMTELCRIMDAEIVNLYKHMLGTKAQGEAYLGLMRTEAMTPANLQAFHAYLRRSGQYLDRQIDLIDDFKLRRDEIAQLPGYQAASLEPLMSEALLNYPRVAWIGLLFDGLGLLAVRQIGHLDIAEDFISLACQPLNVIAQSHGNLIADTQMTLNVRVEVLRDLDIQYEGALGRLEYYREALGEQLDAPSIKRLIERVQELKQQVEDTLTPLVRQQLKASRAERKVRHKASDGLISTRRYGLIVGKLRAGASAGRDQRFDVRDRINDRVVSSFEKDLSDGDWIEVLPEAAARALSPRELLAQLNAEVRKGKALLGPVKTRIASARQQATRDYLPQDIETLLVQYAARLNKAADAIERILTQNNVVDLPSSGGESVEVQVKTLRETAQQLIDEGQKIRVQMTLRQSPSAPRVAWLHRLGAVRVRKEGGRVALRKGQGYLQEYAVTDLKNAPLWYAHFHYNEAAGDVHAWTHAHLKTLAQRRQGQGTQQRQEAQGDPVIAILRSRIDPPLDDLYVSAV